MPAKKTQLTDAERAKRIREAAEKHGTSNDPKDLEKAFKRAAKASANRCRIGPIKKRPNVINGLFGLIFCEKLTCVGTTNAPAVLEELQLRCGG